MFVILAEIEERRHGERYESANMSRPNLFNVLMKLSDSELYCILHVNLHHVKYSTVHCHCHLKVVCMGEPDFSNIFFSSCWFHSE